VRTPRGFLFISGYWDYSLDRRGVLFAPVYFGQPFYMQPGYFLSPSITLDLGTLQFSLFTYPSYSHYCFGDYYDDSFVRLGIFPWFEVERHHRWYDPVFEYSRWDYGRRDPGWLDRERHDYDQRRADRNLRPPDTYRELEARRAGIPQDQRRDFLAARPLNEVVSNPQAPVRFQRLDRDEQRRIANEATEIRRRPTDTNTRLQATPDQQRAAQEPAGQQRANQQAEQQKAAQQQADQQRASQQAEQQRANQQQAERQRSGQQAERQRTAPPQQLPWR
jgi:hypothetical protein